MWSPSHISHELTYIWYLNFKLRDLIGAHVWEGFPSGSAVKSPPVMQKTEAMRAWSLGQEDPLEEEMATRSSILDWIIPWTEEPGELQSTGSQRIGHDWSDWARTHTAENHDLLLYFRPRPRNPAPISLLFLPFLMLPFFFFSIILMTFRHDLFKSLPRLDPNLFLALRPSQIDWNMLKSKHEPEIKMIQRSLVLCKSKLLHFSLKRKKCSKQGKQTHTINSNA